MSILKGPEMSRGVFQRKSSFEGGGGICVKWVPFVKLAFSPGNRAHFGPKWVYFRPFGTTFSMIVAQIVVFIVISPFPPF